jgi:Protein of unknown function (DUF3298)
MLLIIIAGSIVLCLSCEENAERNPIERPIPSPSEALRPIDLRPKKAARIEKSWSSKWQFRPRSIHRSHTGLRSYEISAEYPDIHPASFRSIRIFNRWMAGKVKGYIRQFRRLEESAETMARRKGLKPLSITEALGISFRVYYSDRRLISLRLTHQVMAVGQMHPIDYYETINYDLLQRRPLCESDLFKSGYPKVLSTFTRAHLKKIYEMDYAKDDVLRAGTEAKRRNFLNWNVVPEGLLISFDDYQIAPHSFGQLELIVPYAELRTVMRSYALRRGLFPNREKL